MVNDKGNEAKPGLCTDILFKRGKNGEWRRLHNEELHSLYLSLNKVRTIKSKKIKMDKDVIRKEDGRIAFKFYQVKLHERDL